MVAKIDALADACRHAKGVAFTMSSFERSRSVGWKAKAALDG